MSDSYIYVDLGTEYQKVLHSDGIRTTICTNRFEILASPTGEIKEQAAIQQLRDWIKWRRENEVQ
jgi:hypothetical protein